MDITITKHDDERDLVEGVTEEGIEFVDSFFPTQDYEVLDAGRLLILEAETVSFREAGVERGLDIR